MQRAITQTVLRDALTGDPTECLRTVIREAGGTGTDTQVRAMCVRLLLSAPQTNLLAKGILMPVLRQIHAGLGHQVNVDDLARRATTAVLGGTA